MSEEKATTARKIYFFRIEHFFDAKDRLRGALERIENLPFDDGGRYLLEATSGARLCAFPDSLEYPLRMRFGRTRRNQLPDVENKGTLEALELAENAGLIDLGHLIIFEDGHVAAEWNPDGPKIQKLSHYLCEKGGLTENIKFRNLFERDIVEVVNRLGSVRVLDISLPPDAVAIAREVSGDLADAIEATERMGATKKVGLTLTAERGSGKLKELALRLANIIHRRPADRDQFTVLRATGFDEIRGLTRYVDILEDKLVTGEMFPKREARSRSLDSEEAYRLIYRSYTEMKPRLDLAATAGEI